MKDHRIQYHIQYNTLIKKRLITWKFEYLTTDDGQPIHNIWRQLSDTKGYYLYTSSHWNLYPEDHKKRIQDIKLFYRHKIQFLKCMRWEILGMLQLQLMDLL